MQKNTDDMINMPEITVDRDYPCFQPSPSGAQRRKYQRYFKTHSTYLGLIAYVIQESPNKRLTFSQVMDKLQAFLSGDRKGLVNNIRVCLSSNPCFVKVPVNPENPRARSNFWIFDESQITPKILRRHFKGKLDIFPGWSSKAIKAAELEEAGVSKSMTDSFPVHNSGAVKFSGPFSIDSILKKNSSCSNPAKLFRAPGASPQILCSKRQMSLSSQNRASYRSHTSGETAFLLHPGYFTEDPSHPTFGDLTGSSKRMRISSGVPTSLSPTASSMFQICQNNYPNYCFEAFSSGQKHFRI